VISGSPSSSCSTFARRDFILVPSPAARITTFSLLSLCELLAKKSSPKRSYGDSRVLQRLPAAVQYNSRETIGVMADLFAFVE